MPDFRPLGPTLLLASALALTLPLGACDSAEDRANRHYQSAITLLDEGDEERAMVELRNVFRYDGEHIRARQTYAELLEARGEYREALGQFLRLAEQDPQNAIAHRQAAALALRARDLETAGIHANKAFQLAPGDPMARALKATMDYRNGDGEEQAAAIAMARGVLEDDPANVPAHMIVIAEAFADDDAREALARIDTALAEVPGDEGLHLTRLTALEMLGETEETGAELREMFRLFPDNEGVHDALIQWYLRNGDPDGAETVLREAAAMDPGNPAPKLTVARFLYELEGPEAARAELENLAADAADPTPFQRALAEIDFSEGRQDAAIATLRGLLEGAEPSDATRALQTTLAGMLAETGGTEEAAALAETVLEGDAYDVDALKLRARLAIEDDRPGEAVRDMRTALGQAPRDPEIMTIMARAHEREGARELMGERLALAVEVSNRGAEESLRYAAYLMQEGRPGPAEGVVVDALRLRPEHRELLNMLGRIHIARKDWARAGQVASILRGLGDPAAIAMANAIEAESLRGEGRAQEAVDLLAGIAEEGGDARALADVVRAQVEAGDLDGAKARLEEALAREPGNIAAKTLLAGVHATAGETEDAEALYRDLIGAVPEAGQIYQAYFALLSSEGRTEEALAVLDAGIAASGDPELMFTKAGMLEARGDVPGAISLYETLYAGDSGALVVANNLASLLTSPGANPGGDPETAEENLKRAWVVARRLRGADEPHFQDTYGWILHRRGDPSQALPYLARAAEALPDNALVRFHLAEAQFALGQRQAARESFVQALSLAGEDSPFAARDAARARIAEIDAQDSAAAEETGSGSASD